MISLMPSRPAQVAPCGSVLADARKSNRAGFLRNLTLVVILVGGPALVMSTAPLLFLAGAQQPVDYLKVLPETYRHQDHLFGTEACLRAALKFQWSEDTLNTLLAVQKSLRQYQRQKRGDRDEEYLKLLGDHASFCWELSLRRAQFDPPVAGRLRRVLVGMLEEGLSRDFWQVVEAHWGLDRQQRLGRLSQEDQARVDQLPMLDRKVQAAYREGDFSKAFATVQLTQEIRRHCFGTAHPEYALSLNNLGMLYRAVGDLDRAALLLSQAWELRRQTLGENHPQTALSLNNLGVVHLERGDFTQADRCLRRSLATIEKVVEPRHQAHLQALNNLAVLYQNVGDHRRAQEILARVLALHRQTAEDSQETRLRRWGYLGGLHEALGWNLNWAGVLSRSVYASGAFGYDFATEIVYLNNLSRSCVMLGKADQAERYLLEASQVFDRETQGGKRPDSPRWVHATTLHNLGLVYLAQQKYTEALQPLEQALAIRQAAPGSPDYARTLTGLGALHYYRGEWTQAAQHFRQTLELRKKALGEKSLAVAESLSNLALLHDAQGEVSQALPLAQWAMDICRGHLLAASFVQSEQQQLALLQTFRGFLDHYLSLAVRSGTPGQDLYAPVLLWKGSVLLRQQRLRERQLVLGSGQEKTIELGRQLEEVARQFARLTGRSIWLSEQERVQKLAELDQRREQLERELAATVPAVNERQQAERLTPVGLQSALPPGVALLDFLEFIHHRPGQDGKRLTQELHLLAVVVRPGQPITAHDLGPSAPIATAAEQWRGTLQRRHPVLGPEAPAVRLRQLAWSPLEKELEGVATVLVSPDGPLAQLPLGALPGKDPKRYLLEEMALGVLPVPRALPALLAASAPGTGEPARTGKPSLLLVADVDFAAAPGREADHVGLAAPRAPGVGGTWRELPGTRGEMLLIRDSFERRYPAPNGQMQVLRGAEATENQFRQQAPLQRWIHVATHGFFPPREYRSALSRAQDTYQIDKPGMGEHWGGYHPGLLSGLVLAGANRTASLGEDDGILTALEVAELNLGRAEMVVLSACGTGLGEVISGEGVLGLQRAFQVAGARTVVASLCSVQDEATRQLMGRFYENLWQKRMPRLAALREAQLWMLEVGEERGMVRRPEDPATPGRTPPLYWALFVLSGDWR